MIKPRCFLVLMLLLFAGCIGTEYIDDPVSPVAQQLVVSPSNVALQVGQSVQLQAMYVSGENVGPIDWSSSDNAVVGVSAAGVATAHRTGQARVTARSGGTISEEALITVVANANQVARVVVTPSSVQKNVGGTQQFTATAYNLNNEIITGVTPTWNSSNTSVVTITSSGLATAAANGSASITATVDGIQSNTAQFTVSSTSRSGTFVMRPGSGHDVRGTATLSQQTGGNLVLTLGSDFASAGGPDVRVYLSTTNAVTPSSVSLGQLQRFAGLQTYAVPSSVQLNSFDWVIVHCVPFNITFGYARLQ